MRDIIKAAITIIGCLGMTILVFGFILFMNLLYLLLG